MENHVVECKHKITETGTKPIKCLFHDAGCAAEFKTNEESQDHISKNMNYHLTVTVICKYFIVKFCLKSYLLFLVVMLCILTVKNEV